MIVVSLSMLGIGITEHFGIQVHGNVSYLKKNTRKFQENSKAKLFESHIKIKAANGSSIENSGKCDITFKIGNEFTFSFLVSSTLTQEVILGYNFSRTFHIGTGWNELDEMYLTMNRKQLTTTISTTAINALVQCAESKVIPPRSNECIKCKAPNIIC